MAGAIKFYKECKKQDIIPIIGSEIYITLDKDGQEKRNRDNYHLVVLVKNSEGYKTLIRLLSEAMLQNFYYKPRVNIDKLSEFKGNAIALSACLAGPLTAVAEWNEEKKEFSDPKGIVIETCSSLARAFTKEDFYLELQDWDDGSGRQPAWNKFLLSKVAPTTNLKPVITTDAHYLSEDDYEVHELTMALQMKMTLQQYREGDTMKYGPWFWMKPPRMMLESAIKLGCEEAFYNTGEIARKCSGLEIELGNYQKPPTIPLEQMEDYKEFMEWLATKQKE